MNNYSAEKPVTFIKPLENKEILEGETVELKCEMDQAEQSVSWYKDGEPVKVDDRHTLTVDGVSHTLTIKDATLDDEADYTVRLGKEETTGSLFVEGKNLLLSNIQDQENVTVDSFLRVS